MIKGIKRKLDLGVQTIPIIWVNETEMKDELDIPEGDEAPDGAWDDEGMRILLHRRLLKMPRYARQIYLHEISHAALDLYHRVR